MREQIKIKTDQQLADTDGYYLESSIKAILEQEGAMNTCQLCRRVHNRDKLDVDFCNKGNTVKIRGLSNFKRFGHRYENCVNCRPSFSKIYYRLKKLWRKMELKSKRLRFNDPQKKGRHWDTMRFWGLNLDKILKQTIDYWVE